jgi:predicted membrane protein
MENYNTNDEKYWREAERSSNRGKILGGFFLVLAGSLFIAREMGQNIPHWLLTWKAALIALGLVFLVKHGFKRAGGLVLIAVGGAFLINDFYPQLHLRPLVWPIVIIFIGLVLMFRPRRKGGCGPHRWARRRAYMNERSGSTYAPPPGSGSQEDFIESTSFMAGVKKNIVSKNFKGGDITNVFGGTELNLTQADFEKQVSLELTQVFGGTKLIVPANWQIRSELVTVLGSVEDHRPTPATDDQSGKVLVLTGTTFFGGIEIQSY